MPATLPVTPLLARRFVRRALRLDAPLDTVAAALDYLGYVQIDPINVCGRMHDLILRPRVAGYREGDLMRYLHGADEPEPTTARATDVVTPRPLAADTRRGFEHHLPDTSAVLAAFPLEAWPHLLGMMQTRSRAASAWMGRLTPRERELAPELLATIAARGPLTSQDFNDDRRAHRIVWGKSSLVKSTLQKLFFHGRLLIAERRNNRRAYDLPERILPPDMVSQPAASSAETRRWLAELKLRQRRLVALKREELRAVDDLVQRVAVENCPPLYALRADAPLWDEVAATPEPAPHPLLLAPLDPLIYDRKVTAALWNFDYRWEAYTPAAKRVRGHYALPVLAGTEMVGYAEPKLDRAAGRLRLVSHRVRRGHPLTGAVRALAAWLGVGTKAHRPRITAADSARAAG